eukprot:tig00021179_g19275.t1
MDQEWVQPPASRLANGAQLGVQDGVQVYSLNPGRPYRLALHPEDPARQKWTGSRLHVRLHFADDGAVVTPDALAAFPIGARSTLTSWEVSLRVNRLGFTDEVFGIAATTEQHRGRLFRIRVLLAVGDSDAGSVCVQVVRDQDGAARGRQAPAEAKPKRPWRPRRGAGPPLEAAPEASAGGGAAGAGALLLARPFRRYRCRSRGAGAAAPALSDAALAVVMAAAEAEAARLPKPPAAPEALQPASPAPQDAAAGSLQLVPAFPRSPAPALSAPQLPVAPSLGGRPPPRGRRRTPPWTTSCRSSASSAASTLPAAQPPRPPSPPRSSPEPSGPPRAALRAPDAAPPETDALAIAGPSLVSPSGPSAGAAPLRPSASPSIAKSRPPASATSSPPGPAAPRRRRRLRRPRHRPLVPALFDTPLFTTRDGRYRTRQLIDELRLSGTSELVDGVLSSWRQALLRVSVESFLARDAAAVAQHIWNAIEVVVGHPHSIKTVDLVPVDREYIFSLLNKVDQVLAEHRAGTRSCTCGPSRAAPGSWPSTATWNRRSSTVRPPRRAATGARARATPKLSSRLPPGADFSAWSDVIRHGLALSRLEIQLLCELVEISWELADHICGKVYWFSSGDAEDQYLEAYASRTMGMVAMAFGRWKAAKHHLGRSVELVELLPVGYRLYAERVYKNLGHLAYHTGDIVTCLRYCRKMNDALSRYAGLAWNEVDLEGTLVAGPTGGGAGRGGLQFSYSLRAAKAICDSDLRPGRMKRSYTMADFAKTLRWTTVLTSCAGGGSGPYHQVTNAHNTYQLGLTTACLGDWRAALDHFEEAERFYSLHPAYFPPHLGRCRDVSEAIRVCRENLRLATPEAARVPPALLDPALAMVDPGSAWPPSWPVPCYEDGRSALGPFAPPPSAPPLPRPPPRTDGRGPSPSRRPAPSWSVPGSSR